ncbi:MAG: ribulose-phosphate 3-epimerase [Candidatus Marinimicrobia bacterium]|nr:ribulose-phosphate 3-epimerase [Candidatus Neomarinimicrobiota bacterium]MBL7066479.1 ribulose-phosphate 3-epimerase [Candidatus Neomarinimicrobiota bacterium]
MMEIVPSLLSADFSNLAKEIRAVEKAGARRLHLDVMDGHFVPNITIGPFIVEAIRQQTNLHLESHLMIENPDKYIDAFVKAGSDTVIIHIEASKDIRKDLAHIRDLGANAGLVLNPPTDFKAIELHLAYIDHLLVMTVDPGFGGQKLIRSSLSKVTLAKPYQDKYGFYIEVDGGININTLAEAKAAGTDLFVAGSAVFSKHQPYESFKELSEKLIGE